MSHPSKSLTILDYLYQNTDDKHEVSTRDLKNMLADAGMSVTDSRTIDEYVNQLIASGYSIAKRHENGRPIFYHVSKRDLTLSEMKIVIDAIAASPFINLKRSQEIIHRFANMASQYERNRLGTEDSYAKSIKSDTVSNLPYINRLYKAMVQGKMVRIHTAALHVKRRKIVSEKGKDTYLVTPYSILEQDGRHVLIAYNEENDDIISIGLTSIFSLSVLNETGTPAPKNFTPKDYSPGKNPHDQEKEKITLEFDASALSDILDRFGPRVDCTDAGKGKYHITVRLLPNRSFFSWLFNQSGHVRILASETAGSTFDEMLRKSLS